ncbi:hypothetical protein COO60DRAFT_651290 [Scenedesmus sp. NREL 46B-D3]|nr:hypothetical protein COO60DRAFT_651290 [Scenedesmus sp. NREL 46B-D3]
MCGWRQGHAFATGCACTCQQMQGRELHPLQPWQHKKAASNALWCTALRYPEHLDEHGWGTDGDPAMCLFGIIVLVYADSVQLLCAFNAGAGSASCAFSQGPSVRTGCACCWQATALLLMLSSRAAAVLCDCLLRCKCPATARWWTPLATSTLAVVVAVGYGPVTCCAYAVGFISTMYSSCLRRLLTRPAHDTCYIYMAFFHHPCRRSLCFQQQERRQQLVRRV